LNLESDLNTTEPETFDWTQFHAVAERLLDSDDDAALRSAVSRDYYAVFHRAKEVVATLDPAFSPARGYESHHAIWDAVRALQRKQAMTLARVGESLLAKRKLADYQQACTGWCERARLAHTEAARGLQQAAELMASRTS
jgi:uncharacterized protein (UPF0332 family)